MPPRRVADNVVRVGDPASVGGPPRGGENVPTRSGSGPTVVAVPSPFADPLPTVDDAAKAFVYGYPLVYDLDEVAKFVRGAGSFPVSAPYNTFGLARELLGPETKFVSPNNDTLYVIAMCDVRPGPMVLDVPDTAGRYYVLQFVDAWTNNFAYVGRRATGAGAGRYLLVAPGYGGPVPDGAVVITAPTTVFSIIGRVQVDGADDLPAVHALQDQFTLVPLDDAASTTDRAGPGEIGVPAPDRSADPDLMWWEKFRTRLAAFPPPAADAEFVVACAALGLTANATPFADPPAEVRYLLMAGERAGREMIEALMGGGGGGAGSPGGWMAAAHYFDYNVDFLEVGTLDEDAWKIADRTVAYATRAVAARAGLWGNHGYEADYRITAVDSDGQGLDGAHTYELRLDVPPPVDAFWSLTMYDTPDFYLVANPIDRYSIGDRTPGLVTADDGSVTITMQVAEPDGAAAAANWLPTPAGAFRPILRLYQPREAALSGDWVLPPIHRTA